jgi:hypothetical protein
MQANRRKFCTAEGCQNYRHYAGVCKEHFVSTSHRNTPLHNAWCNMKARCLGRHHGSEMYPDKNITYSQDWETFTGFLRDMQGTWKPGLTLDRIDNSKGYYKENCRWATRAQQAQNRDCCVVTLELAIYIRELYATNLYTQARLAELFGLNPHNIADIVSRSYHAG